MFVFGILEYATSELRKHTCTHCLSHSRRGNLTEHPVHSSLFSQVVVFKFLKLVTEPNEAGRSLARGSLSQDRTVPLQRTPYFTAFSHDDVNAAASRTSRTSANPSSSSVAAGAAATSSSSSSSKVVSSVIGSGQMHWAGSDSNNGGGRRRSSTTDDATTSSSSSSSTSAWIGGGKGGQGLGEGGQGKGAGADTGERRGGGTSSSASSFDWGPVTLSSISPIAIVHGRPIETLQLLRTILCLLLPPLWCPDGARGLPGLKNTLSAWINRHASNRFIDLLPVRGCIESMFIFK